MPRVRKAAVLRRSSAPSSPPPGSVQAHVYSNGGTGGPVDYATVYATSAGTSFVTPALAAGDWTFAVRMFSPSSGLEERNVEARYRVVVDASGNDVTGVPPAPTGLTAVPARGGVLSVRWAYPPVGVSARYSGSGPRPPTGFRLYAGSPAPDFTGPAFLTVAYRPGVSAYDAEVPGLTPGVPASVTVRAYNAAGEEANTLTASATPTAASAAPSSPVYASARTVG